MTGPVEVYAAEDIRSVTDAVLASLPMSYAPGAERIRSGRRHRRGGGLAERGRRRLGRRRRRVIVVEPQPADTEGCGPEPAS